MRPRTPLLFLMVASSVLTLAPAAQAQADSSPQTQEWEAFYLIVGSSAGALTGLMFVVVALAVDAESADRTGVRAFGTPTVVHFGAVLLLSCILMMPRPAGVSLAWLTALVGILGLGFLATTARHMFRSEAYTPVRSDWTWHLVLPAAGYGLLCVSGAVLGAHPELGLLGVGGAALLLLFIGIRNAWDAAVWISVDMRKKPARPATGEK